MSKSRLGHLLAVLLAFYDSNEREVSEYTIMNVAFMSSEKLQQIYYDVCEVEVPELDDTAVYSRMFAGDLNQLVSLGILIETTVREDLGKGLKELKGYKITEEGLKRGAKFLHVLERK